MLAEVLDMQVGRPGLRAGPNRQRREADVLPGYADPVILDRKRQPGSERGAQRLHDPIAEQVGAGVVAGPHQAGGQDERRREVGRPITRLDLVHRAMQRVAVPGDRGQDSGGGPHGNDGHPVRRPELVDDGIDLPPGFSQA